MDEALSGGQGWWGAVCRCLRAQDAMESVAPYGRWPGNGIMCLAGTRLLDSSAPARRW